MTPDLRSVVDDGPCTFTGPNGQQATANGAQVGADGGVVYVADIGYHAGYGPRHASNRDARLVDRGTVTDWHGNAIGTWELTGAWTNNLGARIAAVRVVVAGRAYVGRFGYEWSQAVRIRPAKH